jgi:hypothetical protein
MIKAYEKYREAAPSSMAAKSWGFGFVEKMTHMGPLERLLLEVLLPLIYQKNGYYGLRLALI